MSFSKARRDDIPRRASEANNRPETASKKPVVEMATARIVGGAIVAVVIAGAAAAFAVAYRPAIAAIEPPAPPSFDPALVKRGRELAAMGNCNDCHTPRGGKAFSGGVPVPTQFGTIYSSNITPDPDTGIGRWSEEAFRRAMRSGVDRDGAHLYPTFPYDHFTHVTDADDRALYAFLMTRQPVHASPPANKLSFPYDQRYVIAGWKLLFLHGGNWQPDPAQSAEWNRGGYLVEGLAHCGSCHTPRNALGAEEGSKAFSGGDVDNWHAYAINAQSPAPVPWTTDALTTYLRTGSHPDHGVARGPMAEVVSNLSSVPEADVHAIAVYMGGVFGAPSEDRKRRGDEVLARAKHLENEAPAAQQPSTGADATGAAIYRAACATCHETSRTPPYGGVSLHLSSSINGTDARNAANVILNGIRPVPGERSPIMPPFAASMNDTQMVALLTYLRSRFSGRPAWTDLDRTVAQARHTETLALRTSPGPENAPADPTQRDKP
jgi:mono/diheme cytochrome c family protein